jgi:hypothetical protein
MLNDNRTHVQSSWKYSPQCYKCLPDGNLSLENEDMSGKMRAYGSPTYTLSRFKVATCFGHYLPIFRRHYTNATLVAILCGCTPPHKNPNLRCCRASWRGASIARNRSRLWNLGRIYTFALWICIEDDSSVVNVNDESWSVYTFQWFNSFH